MPTNPIPRKLLAVPAAALALLGLPAGASAAASCSFDAAAAKVSVDYSGAGTLAKISRTGAGAITVDGAQCGTATVTNTDTIAATAGSGAQRLVIDVGAGQFGPGRTSEGTGSEIEFAVDGGSGGEITAGDEVQVLGNANANLVRFGGSGILLTPDTDVDVTTTNVETLGADGGGGDDRLLGSGDGSGGPEASVDLRLLGGPGNDTLVGGADRDTLEGGSGNDSEQGMGDADTFRQGPSPDGSDVLDGGGSPYDRIDYSGRTGAVRVDLDDVADDGAPNELDDVRDTFEYLNGGAGADTIVASQTRYQPFAITGNGGDDKLTGGSNYDELDGGAGNDTLTGNNGSDTFRAGPGNDKQLGGDGADTFHESETAGPNGADDVWGGAGADHYYAPDRTDALAFTMTDGLANDGAPGEGDNVHSDVDNLTGGKAADRIVGTATANVLSGAGGDDIIEARGGNDTVYGRGGADTITGSDGDDDLNGNEDADWVDGGAGNDIVRGSYGNDRLGGGIGNDQVHGEADDDVILEPATTKDGNDLLNGGGGDDEVSYAARTVPVQVSLDGVANDGDQTPPSPETDNVIAERVIGGEGADRLAGSAAADRLAGGQGDDELDGLGGDDTLDGGVGADKLTGGDGADLADYASRTVALTISLDGNADDGAAGEGDEVRTDDVIGGSAADRITGDDAANQLDGGAGDDTLDGRRGADVLTGGDGVDTATYAGRAAPISVTLDGAANDGEDSGQDGTGEEGDKVAGTIENVVGGDWSDRLTGDAQANVLTGGEGNDRLDGGDGADVLDGQGGRDTADYSSRAGAVSVTLDAHAVDGADADGDGSGEEGDKVTTTVEIVEGGAGNDRLAGGAFNEELRGNKGNDLLYGSQAANAMDGDDVFAGGDGSDTVSYAGRLAANPVRVTIDGLANDGRADDTEKDNVKTDVENLTGGRGDDELTGNDAANTLNGGPFGRDVLHGEGGDDRLDESAEPQYAPADGDQLWGGAGRDTADYSKRTTAVSITIDDSANDGIPSVDVSKRERDNVRGDVETVVGTPQGDYLWGSPGEDRLEGAGGTDHLDGLAGNDALIGGDEVDWIDGNAGDDRIEGGPGNNSLKGGDGDDTFVEAATWIGNDGFTGGAGRDMVDYGKRSLPIVADNDNASGDDGQDADGDGDPEELDRVGDDIEVMRGGSRGDTLTQVRDLEDRCGTLMGGAGDDVLTGNGSREAFYGDAGSDTINAGDGEDWLMGGQGSDHEIGGDGRDTFVQGGMYSYCGAAGYQYVSGGDGADRMIGGDDDGDVVLYRRTADTPIAASLDGLANDGAAGEGDNVQVEDVLGGEGNDVLIGDGNDNRLNGMEGDDRVEARGGDDELFEGWNGADVLLGEDGNDEIRVKDGDPDDTLNGGNGSDSGEWDPGDTVSNME